MRCLRLLVVAFALCALSAPLFAQFKPLDAGARVLIDLETRFARDVAIGGGKAFVSWFAEDGVSLANGRAAVVGRRAIAAETDWDPKSYQLTWTPTAAQMGPSSDMGYTWGHFEGRSTDKSGKTSVVSGRYMTVWKKLPNGTWKVALDASATEPAAK
jgi:ketosteroid isomerase-like protein